MENTLSNKAKFFVLYWGQRILFSKNDPAGYSIRNKFEHSEDLDTEDFLQLKPLSSITDEDFDFIMNDSIMNPDPSDGDPVFTFEIGCLKLSDLTTTDYLRSKGYALPWMGLSVEKLQEYGWIKITE